MTQDNPTTRRNVLKGVAGAAALAGVGGGALLYATGPSTAASVTIGDTTTHTDDGDLSFFDLALDHYYAIWDGFDKPVAAVAFRDRVVHLASGDTHELFDQRGDDANPVLLENISPKGDGSGGWGGAGEYASTYDTKTAPDTGTYQQPGVDGPVTATAGYVHADVFWRLATDDPSDSGHSIETPAVLGDDLPAMDNPDDGTTDHHDIKLIKEVYLYRHVGDDESADRKTQDGTLVKLMGGDDGTKAKIVATPPFTVSVKNDPEQTGPKGGGNAQSG